MTKQPKTRPAVFLDRDGVLIRDSAWPHKPEHLDILPGTVAGLQILRRAGFSLIVVSNQSGVARGMFSEEQVQAFHKLLHQALQDEGDVAPDAWYYCPHHPEGSVPEYAITCACRKPGIGMLEEACSNHHLGRQASWMIGDKISDMECARNAGIPGLQIRGRYETDDQAPTFADLQEAARWIIEHPR